jgi:hypothetical protein
MSPPSSGSKNNPSKKAARQAALLAIFFYADLLFGLFYLKIEAICFCETSVDLHLTTRRYIPEDRTLHNHRFEILKSHIFILSLLHLSDLLIPSVFLLLYHDLLVHCLKTVFRLMKLH